MSNSAGRTSGDEPAETLERRLRELLPDRIPKEMELSVESLAEAVLTKIGADDQIRSSLIGLRPLLKQAGTLEAAYREIGTTMGKADGQPVRRMMHPPPKTRAAKKEPRADRGSSDVAAGGEILAPTPPAAVTAPSRPGRKVTWAQDRLREDDFIVRAVEEAAMYLPAAGDQPHPQAADLVCRLVMELRLTPESIAEAFASDGLSPQTAK